MARPKEVFDEKLAQAATVELHRIRDHEVCFRLNAIVSCTRHSVTLVASVLDIHVTTLWRWARRFQENGVSGLHDRPKGHNPSKLDLVQQQRIAAWLEAGKNEEGGFAFWTIPLLQQEVHRIFGIRMGKTPLRLMIRKMGFRPKVPRPIHAKTDLAVREAFKKKLQNR